MDHVEQEALRRIYHADDHRRQDGRDPERFHLSYAGGRRGLDHPGWDPSWGAPSEHTVDELADRGFVRLDAVVPFGAKQRSFVLTSAGRTEGQVLHERRGFPTAVGGWAPPLPTVLAWLLTVFTDAPQCFAPPSGLLDRAVSDGLITETGRDVLASRILGLASEGYLSGDVFDSDQATDAQTLQWTPSLSPTMLAYRASEPGSPSVTVFGDVTNSTIAGHTVSVSVFVELLDRAAEQIAAMDDVPEETKRAAGDFIARWRERASTAAGGVAVAAGGGLATEVISQLLRIHQ